MPEPNDPALRRPVTLEKLDAISGAAFHAARDAHRRKGVPLVFVRDGRKLWELPDGTVVDANPLAQQAPEGCG